MQTLRVRMAMNAQRLCNRFIECDTLLLHSSFGFVGSDCFAAIHRGLCQSLSASPHFTSGNLDHTDISGYVEYQKTRSDIYGYLWRSWISFGPAGNLFEIGYMFGYSNGYLIKSMDIHLDIFYIRIYPRNPSRFLHISK